jgi:hypothetical protein
MKLISEVEKVTTCGLKAEEMRRRKIWREIDKEMKKKSYWV